MQSSPRLGCSFHRDFMAALVGGTPRVHGPRCHVREPYWAKRAVPVPDRRHRLFYQHMLAVLGVDDDWTRRTGSIRGFGSLPDDIREQASWGRLISDPQWGTPILSGERSRKLPFIDITDAYERSVA